MTEKEAKEQLSRLALTIARANRFAAELEKAGYQVHTKSRNYQGISFPIVTPSISKLITISLED